MRRPNNNHPPTISVVIPVYNASRSIADTLTTVFAQTRTDYEVLLVDDGSSDVVALDQAIAPWRHRIRQFRQQNAGAGAARNLAINNSVGQFVAFIDADDGWMPEFLERQVRLLEMRRDLDMVWTNGLIRGNTPLAGRTYFETTASAAPPSFQSLLLQTCTVLTSSVVVRRSALDAVGGFDRRIRRGQDFDLWLRLAHRGIGMAARPEPLVWRRVHENNLSGDAISEVRRAITVLEEVPRKLMLTPDELGIVQQRLTQLGAQLELELGKRALRTGDLVGAQQHFSRTHALRTWKVRAVAMAMRISPALVRRAYLRAQPPQQNEGPQSESPVTAA
jgi:glycosyltransferase involved in cell wall biosynthesis